MGRAHRGVRAAAFAATLLALPRSARPDEVRIEAPAAIARFDPAEFRITVDRSRAPPGSPGEGAPAAPNPFTEVEVKAEFRHQGGAVSPIRVEGFCAARDGSLHLLRFSPPEAGEWSWSIDYRSPGGSKRFSGRLRAGEGGRPGPVVADPAHPRKLIQKGTGKPFFHLGYTAYHLLDPSNDDPEIERTIAFCDQHGFNKVRFLLTGYPRDPPGARPRPRQEGDGEFGVVDPFTQPNYGARSAEMNPLPAWEGKPHAFDFLRMNPEHWRRADRAVRLLRERGMVATLIFTIEKQDLPKEYGVLTEAERLLYRYAVARFAAFDNVWWDLGNEHNEYRDARWGEAMGRFVRERDPYGRLLSAHAYAEFLYPRSEWATFIIVQHYGDPRTVRDWVLKHRGIQKPFVNEEYGYEGRGQVRRLSGHGAPRDETRRRHWAIAFGGGYATYGDWVDGAWFYEGVPGPGEAARELKHLRAFCESIPFNRLEPADELLAGDAAAFALAAPGRIAVYLPAGGTAALRLEGEPAVRAEWYDPRTGKRSPAAPRAGGERVLAFEAPGAGDWALDAELR